MTVKERVLVSRLIQKINKNKSYAEQIGLNYTMSMDVVTERKEVTHACAGSK